MNDRIAGLLIAGITLSATPYASTRLPAAHPAAEVEILVNGAPQRRYAHDGRWYVEALKGKEYAIRLHNPYPVRVGVALSVDGLNTIDARETTAKAARKWVLDPFQTVIISGWQTSQTEARRFEFTTEAGSYGQALGKTANLGIISAVFFKERVRARPQTSSSDTSSRKAETAAPEAPGVGSLNEQVAIAQRDEYAATGMGRRADHAVTQVYVDLEELPARAVNIRYEFRAQLVRLGILPAAAAVDPLRRRETARGFEPGFCPEPRGDRR